MNHWRVLLLMAWVLLSADTVSLYAQDASDRWIVILDDHDDEKRLKQQAAKSDHLDDVKPIFKALNAYLVSYDQPIEKSQAQQSLSVLKKRYELYPDAVIETRYDPNDPDYSGQWALRQINMPQVWDLAQGRGTNPDGHDLVVAIFDSGFDVNHPEYVDNLWRNEKEIPNNGIDDDDNGYVDDYLGWNPREGNDQHVLTTHGTSVAGIIGAKGDNQQQVAGVNWNVKLMLTSASLPGGGISIADIIASYEYMYEQRKRYNDTNGAEGAYIIVSNFSGGVQERFPSEFPLWCELYDLLGTEGVLSVTSADNRDVDVEIVGDMPTLCESPYLLTVTNSNQNNQLSNGSAYGAVSVDLAAPGEDIITTTIDGGITQSFRGASASAPYTAGVASLLYDFLCPEVFEREKEDPSFLPLLIKEVILKNVDSSPSLDGRTTSGGVLDAYAAAMDLRSRRGLGDCCSINIQSLNVDTESCRNAKDAQAQISLDTTDVRGGITYTLTQGSDVNQNNDGQFAFLASGDYDLTVYADRDQMCSADTMLSIAASLDSCAFGALELMEVRPNPAQNEIFLTYQLDEAKHFELLIYDAKGALMIRNLNTDGVGSGVMSINTGHLAQGLYIAVLRTNDQVISRRFDVVR